jgi:hypothetical protein
MTTKIKFCCECSIMLDEDHTDVICSNCNCDLRKNVPIEGTFEDVDAEKLRAASLS